MAPPWAPGGSMQVFKSQIQSLRNLDFETYFLAIPDAARDSSFIAEFRRWTTDIGADHRGEARLERLSSAALWLSKRIRSRTAASAAAKFSQHASLPPDLIAFACKKSELFVVCNHYFNVPAVKKLSKAIGKPLKYIVETHDVQAKHYRRRSKTMSRDLFNKNLEDELGFLSKATGLVHISGAEKKIFERLMPSAQHYLAPPALPRAVQHFSSWHPGRRITPLA